MSMDLNQFRVTQDVSLVPTLAAPKPFAALIVSSLRVARFDTKDELQDALKTLKAQDKAFLAFKYHHGIEGYVQWQIWD